MPAKVAPTRIALPNGYWIDRESGEIYRGKGFNATMVGRLYHDEEAFAAAMAPALPSDAREPVRCPFCGDDIPEGFKHQADGSHPRCVVVPRVAAPSDDARECARLREENLRLKLAIAERDLEDCQLAYERAPDMGIFEKSILDQTKQEIESLKKQIASLAPSPTGNAEGVK